MYIKYLYITWEVDSKCAMKIEDEIKQKKFSSLYQKTIVNLFYTSSWFSLRNLQQLKPFGISQEQFNVLRILRGQYPKPASIQLIVERMIDKSSNASRIVEKLRQKGLVERKECEKDRRLVDVIVTDKGLAMLSDIDKTFGEWENSFNTLSNEEIDQLNDLLDKLRG